MARSVSVPGPAACWAMTMNMLSLKVLLSPLGPPWWS